MSSPTLKVKLHSTQAAFHASGAIYQAFVAGIGSGKSWAGAFDLIARSKPGCLYMVVAPTYTMLNDSTFRSFEAVAEQLGVVTDVKRSAPPQMRLKTGAEVLFWYL
jgi:phage terminase large subunit